jgi:hypothetical protein
VLSKHEGNELITFKKTEKKREGKTEERKGGRQKEKERKKGSSCWFTLTGLPRRPKFVERPAKH